MTICVCAPDTGVSSETFIRDHIRRLPGKVFCLSGTHPDIWLGDRQIVPPPVRFLIHERRARKLKPFLLGYAARRVASVLRRHGADVILAEYGTTAVDYLEPCRIAQIPLVVHFHGYDIYRTDVLSQYEVEYKRLFREAAAMIVGSLAMKQHVTTLAGSDDRVFYNPCGVDIGAFLPIDASANPPVFIAVGRFVEKKAPHLTISAFRNVLDACPDAKLIMAGAGPLLDPCRQLVRAYGITDSVEFPGELAHREVAALLRTGRAFVQHSVTAPSGDSEGTAISILEAAATGLPVVSTLHAGIRDTMIHGRTGLLVAEYDIGTMAKHMIELANCPGRAAGLGAAAREHVAANYSMDASISGIAAVLSQAVSRFRERHAHAPDGSVDDRIAGVR